MKFQNNSKMLIFIIGLIGVLSCNFLDEKSEDEKIVKEEKPVTKVDITIDTSNSFNTYFLDETNLQQILQKNNLGDTLTNRIQSFYNSRNYQFAWFSRKDFLNTPSLFGIS